VIIALTQLHNWGEPERARIDEFAVEFVYIIIRICIYCTSCCKSLLALCEFLHRSILQKLVRRQIVCLLDGNCKDRDHSWTYLFNG